MKSICAVFLMFFCAVGVCAIPIPILMYHDFVPDDAPCGEYAVTESEFREQISTLHDEGYRSITFSDLIGYTDGKNTLPDKCVLLTADDGYVGVNEIVVPILREFGMKMSCAVIGSLDGIGEHFSLPEADSDCIEPVSHTYGLHVTDGDVCGVLTASADDFRRDILRMYDTFGAEYPLMNDVFVYPYGAYSRESETVLRDMGFKVSVTCDRGCAEIRMGSELYALPRLGVWHGMDGDDVIRMIEKYK